MSITIKDVARSANVSISTVSKVINGSSRISKATIERVNKVMKDLDYHPNSIARRFVSQSSKTICLVMDLQQGDAFTNPYLYEILGGIEKTIQEKDFFLTITNIRNQEDPISFIVKIIREKRADGLIIHMPCMTPQLMKELNNQKFPFVILGEPQFPAPVSWIDVNNSSAGRLAAEHMIDIGKKEIAFLGGPKTDIISEKRLEGIREVLKYHNKPLKKENTIKGELSSDDGYQNTKDLLKNRKPDGIIVTNSFMALGALKAISELGISIPDKIGVISFDNYPLAPYTTPPLSVVDINVFDLGKQAASMLFDVMREPENNLQNYVLSTKLIVRETTGGE